jgi:hypothetical protein
MSQSLLYLFVTEIKSGKVPCIGLVIETDIHGIRAIVDGSLERRKITGRTYKFHD